jgi:hypothetical protein
MRAGETLSRDAKTYNRRTTVAAYAGIRGLRDSRQQRRSTQSIPLLPHLSHPHITSVKMAGLLGKKFPTPVGMFNARPRSSHFDSVPDC